MLAWSVPQIFPTVVFDRVGALSSFHPEIALFHNLCVNLRICLYGVKCYVSAQILDFIDLSKNCSFPNRKLRSAHLEFPDGRYLDRDVAALSQAARRLATQAADNPEVEARCDALQRLVLKV